MFPSLCKLQSKFYYIDGDMNMVMIVIAPIIGSRNALVTPVATPPWAATKASSPPEDDNPKPALAEVSLSNP
jgi:hypothetical protein